MPNALRYFPIVPVAIGTVAAAWAIRDYRAWRSLGPGGLPHTLGGWLRMTRWRTMMGDPLALEPLRALAGTPGDTAVLAQLPERPGARPRIAPHPVPHRQLDQHTPKSIRPAQQAVFDACVAGDAQKLHYAQSHFEKHTPAVTLRHVCPGHDDASASCGEIAHIHPSDGSMHMILGASDTLRVVERGWGERHGLAGRALALPTTYTLVYAPRDEHDLAIIGEILAASVAHMTHGPAAAG